MGQFVIGFVVGAAVGGAVTYYILTQQQSDSATQGGPLQQRLQAAYRLAQQTISDTENQMWQEFRGRLPQSGNRKPDAPSAEEPPLTT